MESEEDAPFLRDFVARMGGLNIDASRSALCISAGLLSPSVTHVVVPESSAKEQRNEYLDFIGRDAFDELVERLSTSIQTIQGSELSGGGPLDVSIDGGPWTSGACEGAVVTLGRHPRCSVQVVSKNFVSRLQCIVVRAHARLVVYDVSTRPHLRFDCLAARPFWSQTCSLTHASHCALLVADVLSHGYKRSGLPRQRC